MSTFWKTIKNIAALVGMIWGLYKLYSIFFVNVYDLRAYADTIEFHIPSKITRDIVDLGYFSNYAKIDAETRDILELSTLGISYLNYQTIISISNEGDNEIKDIHILTNGTKSLYEFKNSEGVLKTGEASRKIPLGNLLANERIKIVVWHDHNYSKEFSISFPEGSFEIEYSTRLNGMIASVASFIDDFDFWFFIFVIIPVLLQIVSALTDTKKIELKEPDELVDKKNP